MLSEMGKQNKQAKKSFVFACMQVLAARSRHSRGSTAKKKKKMCLIRILRTLREWSRRLRRLRASLHGGGGPQVDEVTGLGGVARLSI